MNAETEGERWYYSGTGITVGPMSFEELRVKAANATLQPPMQMVRSSNMHEWKPAEEVEGLILTRGLSVPDHSGEAVFGQWFYLVGDRQHGPVPIDELKGRLADAELTPQVQLIWTKGMAHWMPIFMVKQLGSILPHPKPAETSESKEPPSHQDVAEPNVDRDESAPATVTNVRAAAIAAIEREEAEALAAREQMLLAAAESRAQAKAMRRSQSPDTAAMPANPPIPETPTIPEVPSPAQAPADETSESKALAKRRETEQMAQAAQEEHDLREQERMAEHERLAAEVKARQEARIRAEKTAAEKAKLAEVARLAVHKARAEQAERLRHAAELKDRERLRGQAGDLSAVAEEEARRKAVEEQRRQEEEARRKAVEEQHRQQEEAKLRQAETARKLAEEEARAAAAARERAEEDAKALAIANARAEAEAKAAASAKSKADEEHRLAEAAKMRAQEDARAAEAARLRAQQEASARAEEEQRLKALVKLKEQEEDRAAKEQEDEIKAEAASAEAEAKKASKAKKRAEAELKAAETAKARADENANKQAAEEQRLRTVASEKGREELRAKELVESKSKEGALAEAQIVLLKRAEEQRKAFAAAREKQLEKMANAQKKEDEKRGRKKAATDKGNGSISAIQEARKLAMITSKPGAGSIQNALVDSAPKDGKKGDLKIEEAKGAASMAAARNVPKAEANSDLERPSAKADSNAVWKYTVGNERFGPVTFDELREMAADATLNPRMDLVWKVGMTEWKPAGQIDGLFERDTSGGDESMEGSASRSGYFTQADGSLSIGRRLFVPVVLLLPLIWPMILRFAGSKLAEKVDPGKWDTLVLYGSFVPVAVLLLLAIFRLSSIGASRWWVFGFALPVLNLWLGFRCFACPRDYVSHNKLDRPGIVLSIVYWLLVLALLSLLAVYFGYLGNVELQQQLKPFLDLLPLPEIENANA